MHPPSLRRALGVMVVLGLVTAFLAVTPASVGTEPGSPSAVLIDPGCGGTFLDVPGIEGASTREGHEGEIEVEAYEYEGKKLVVDRMVDRASPQLAKAAAERKKVGDITLTVECGEASVTMTFRNATVTGYLQQKRAGDPFPTETVTFTFKEVEMTVVTPPVESTEEFEARVPLDRAPCGCDKGVAPGPCGPVIPVPVPGGDTAS